MQQQPQYRPEQSQWMQPQQPWTDYPHEPAQEQISYPRWPAPPQYPAPYAPQVPMYPPQARPPMPMYPQQPYPPQQYMYPPMPYYPPQAPPVIMIQNTAMATNTTMVRQPSHSGGVRLLYFLFIGWWLGLTWAFIALVLCATIVFLPVGIVMLAKTPAVLFLS
jgi:hypothetical protein